MCVNAANTTEYFKSQHLIVLAFFIDMLLVVFAVVQLYWATPWRVLGIFAPASFLLYIGHPRKSLTDFRPLVVGVPMIRENAKSFGLGSRAIRVGGSAAH